MAHALDVRVPIPDHAFVEWVCCLPLEVKLRKQGGKYVFKGALEPCLARYVLCRPRKGLAVPLAARLRGLLKQRVRDALLGPTLRDARFSNMNYVARLVNEHRRGIGERSAALWTLLMCESYMRTVGKGTQA